MRLDNLSHFIGFAIFLCGLYAISMPVNSIFVIGFSVSGLLFTLGDYIDYYNKRYVDKNGKASKLGWVKFGAGLVGIARIGAIIAIILIPFLLLQPNVHISQGTADRIANPTMLLSVGIVIMSIGAKQEDDIEREKTEIMSRAQKIVEEYLSSIKDRELELVRRETEIQKREEVVNTHLAEARNVLNKIETYQHQGVLDDPTTVTETDIPR